MKNLTYSLLGFFLLLLTAYIFGMMMFHIFEEKVKDKSLDTVVVNLYPSRGKKNTFKIKHSKGEANINTSNVVEGFQQGKNDCQCSYHQGDGMICRQKIYKPKSNPKGILKKTEEDNQRQIKLPTVNSELGVYYQDSDPLTTSTCKHQSNLKGTPKASEDISTFYTQPQPDKIKRKPSRDALVEGFSNSYKKCDKLFRKSIYRKQGTAEGFNILEY
jgi:hypothetical protein